MTPFLIALGGLCGALGVALSAVAAHYPNGAQLATAAEFLLVHGPAFLALGALHRIKALPRWAMGIGALLLALGLTLFAGDLARRVFAGERLFHWAAPLGGSILIGGWVWIALVGLFSCFSRPKAD